MGSATAVQRCGVSGLVQRSACPTTLLNAACRSICGGHGRGARAGRACSDDHLHCDDERQREARGLGEERHKDQRREHRHRERAERDARGHAARHQRRRRVALRSGQRSVSATHAQRPKAQWKAYAARLRPPSAHRQRGGEALRHGAPQPGKRGRHCSSRGSISALGSSCRQRNDESERRRDAHAWLATQAHGFGRGARGCHARHSRLPPRGGVRALRFHGCRRF